MSIVTFCKLIIIVTFPFSLMALVIRSSSISSLGVLFFISKNLCIFSLFVSFFSFHPVIILFSPVFSFCSFMVSSEISVIHIVFSSLIVSWSIIFIGSLRKLFSLLFLFLYL